MQKLISKYGLAAHLALLAVAPLFLFPFCAEGWTSCVLLWLSALAAVWMLMEPSRRSDEMLHNARARVFSEIVRDPLFWFSLSLVVLTAIRALNDGIEMVYDAEVGIWSMSAPKMPFMPGGVTGSGGLPFAVSVAFMVLIQGCRRALGKSARLGFLLTVTTLAGVAAIVAFVAGACGNDRIVKLEQCLYHDPSFIGVTFGLYFAASMVTLTGVFEQGWKTSVALLIPAVGGTALGLFLFTPPLELVVFVVLAIVILALSVAYSAVWVGGTVAPKGLVMLIISLLLPVLLVMWVVPPGLTEAKISSIMDWKLLPEGFEQIRIALSTIAEKVWKVHPWLGSGVGTFVMDIKFNAIEADWAVLPPGQMGALNGWWQLLAERGIVGALFLIAPFGFLFWFYIARAVYAVKRSIRQHLRGGFFFSTNPTCWAGPLALAALVGCGFVDYTFRSAEAILAIGAIFALSVGAFPVPKKKEEETAE